jgi:hypothetical protein
MRGVYTTHRQMRNAYEILVEKSERKRIFVVDTPK